MSPINHDLEHLQSRGKIEPMKHMKYASTGNVVTSSSRKNVTRVIKIQNESMDNQCQTTNTGGEKTAKPGFRGKLLQEDETLAIMSLTSN
jgi:hypothetical protein